MPDGTNNLVFSWAWLIICLSIVQALVVTMWRDNLCRLKCLYKRPLMGLLAFFTVVASSQISPHIASWGLLYLYDTAKIGTFVRILFICPMFFSFRTMFFNYLPLLGLLLCKFLQQQNDAFVQYWVHNVRRNLCQRL